MIPVRCFTCGKVLGNLEDTCKDLHKKNKTWKEIFHILNINRYCCKMVLTTYN